MDSNLTQVIVTIIVALGGFLTARYAKRDGDGKQTDGKTIDLLEKRIKELEKELDECYKAKELDRVTKEERIQKLEHELNDCYAAKERDRSSYFDALNAMGQRLKKKGIQTRSRTKRPPK